MSDGRLTIESASVDTAVTLTVVGEVDPHTTDQLDEAVDAALADRPHLVLDFAGVTFIDSAGLRSLIRALRRSEEAGGSLVLRAPRPSTIRVLEITGLTDELTVEGAVEPSA